MGLVPCPNNGACGSRSHNQKSARYRECLASARFSGRGTSVRGMVVPKTSAPGNLNFPLSKIRVNYPNRMTVTSNQVGDIYVWRGYTVDRKIRARFQVRADLGKQLEAAGYVYDANNEGDVLDAFENGDDLWDQIEAFYGMENCDMPGGINTDSFAGTLVIDDDEASTIGDIVDIVNEVARRAESESTAQEFGDFVREGKLNKQADGVQK